MPIGCLLVIAPDLDVRSALVFTLEADGFDVTARSKIPSLAWTESHRFDCTVLDHKAITGEPDATIAFCIKASPVLLLASRPIPWLNDWVTRTVEQPAADDSLGDAIRTALPFGAS